MEPREERRLTTILSADVVGYSRLMAADEAGTHAQLKTLRKELLDPKTADYHGRTVKLTGDGALMEFASVVDAVKFAADVQRAMADRNAAVPEDRRITFRIGINIGDIIVEGDDIYGDGVNVASRLEALAEPGGICVSRTVFDHVRSKVALSFEDLGAQEVKNIPEPVQIYRVLIDPAAASASSTAKRGGRKPWLWAAAAVAVIALIGAGAYVVWLPPWAPALKAASIENMAFPLPDKPSIAVLPFENLSGDAEQDYFVDALTENIITELSRFSDLFVIARNSSFTYKGQAVKVQQVAEDLGVQYVLEGSVQRSADRLRVTTQFVDALTGKHEWAERYDRDVSDIGYVQDEVTEAIVSRLGGFQGQVAEAARKRAMRKDPPNLNAYEALLIAVEHKHRFTQEGNAIAEDMLKKAIHLDPQLARAYVALAWVYAHQFFFGWSDSADESLDLGLATARKAVALDDSDAEAHWVLADLLMSTRNTAQAISRYERALELNPNNADLLTDWGWNLAYLGRANEGFDAIKKAMRLNPYYPDWYRRALGDAAYTARMYDEAIATLTEVETHMLPSRLTLAASYAQLGRRDAAQAQMAKALEFDLDAKRENMGYLSAYPHKNPADEEHWRDGLRKAGLPE